MYSPKLYKYRDSYVLYIPTVHAVDSLLLTHTLLVQTHTHDFSASCFFFPLFLSLYVEQRGGKFHELKH